MEESEIGFNVCGVYEDASSVRTQVWEGGDIEAVSTALRWFSKRMMHHHGCLECIRIDAELMTYAR